MTGFDSFPVATPGPDEQHPRVKRPGRQANFDRIARAYRWLEYLVFARALERCRTLHLASLHQAKRVLVLGDGDGRFTASLLAEHALIRLVALDSSAVMLQLLYRRASAIHASSRVTLLWGDALELLEQDPRVILPADEQGDADPLFDFVCTHFFLDCFTSAEVDRLVVAVCRHMSPGAQWVVSEFAAPCRWARLIVSGLYKGSALLAGLRVERLPLWREALQAHGFVCVSEQEQRRGLLSSSVWQWLPPTQTNLDEVKATTPESHPSHRA